MSRMQSEKQLRALHRVLNPDLPEVHTWTEEENKTRRELASELYEALKVKKEPLKNYFTENAVLWNDIEEIFKPYLHL